jgi:hypothetical protein
MQLPFFEWYVQAASNSSLIANSKRARERNLFSRQKRRAGAAQQSSMRGPDRRRVEKPIDDAYLVHEEQAESETKQSGAGDEPLVQ